MPSAFVRYQKLNPIQHRKDFETLATAVRFSTGLPPGSAQIRLKDGTIVSHNIFDAILG